MKKPTERTARCRARWLAAGYLSLALLTSPGYSGQIRALANVGEAVITAGEAHPTAARVDAEVRLFVCSVNGAPLSEPAPGESQNTQVRPGDTVVFRIHVKNVGTTALLPTGFRAELPEGFEMETSVFNESWRPLGGQMASGYAGEPLEPGRECARDFVAKVAPTTVGGAVVLSAAVTGYLTGSGKLADNARADAASVTVRLDPGDESSNLKTSMTLLAINGTPVADANGRISRGDLLTYRITLTNLGGKPVTPGRIVAAVAPETESILETAPSQNPQWSASQDGGPGMLVSQSNAGTLAPGESSECALHLRVGARANVGDVLKVSLHTTTESDGPTEAQAIRVANDRFTRGEAVSCAVTVSYGELARTGDDRLTLLIPTIGGAMLLIGAALLSVRQGKGKHRHTDRGQGDRG